MKKCSLYCLMSQSSLETFEIADEESIVSLSDESIQPKSTWKSKLSESVA